MKKYYVNKKEQANGDHEVHTDDCIYMPGTENSLFLGVFSSCREAVSEAKKKYSQSNGCKTCCNSCHTS